MELDEEYNTKSLQLLSQLHIKSKGEDDKQTTNSSRKLVGSISEESESNNSKKSTVFNTIVKDLLEY